MRVCIEWDSGLWWLVLEGWEPLGSSSPQPPGNLSSHCSGSLSLMIKSCRETGLVAQWLKCLTQENLASSCEPLKLGSVDPQMGRGLGICILNTTTPVPQPPPTPVSLSSKLRSSWLCQPVASHLTAFAHRQGPRRCLQGPTVWKVLDVPPQHRSVWATLPSSTYINSRAISLSNTQKKNILFKIATLALTQSGFSWQLRKWKRNLSQCHYAATGSLKKHSFSCHGCRQSSVCTLNQG